MTVNKILEEIVEKRQKKEITQTAMAKALGVNPTIVSMLERGKLTLSLQRFLRICEVLQVAPYHFLWGEDKQMARKELLIDVVENLSPDDMELVLVIAQTLRNRQNLQE